MTHNGTKNRAVRILQLALLVVLLAVGWMFFNGRSAETTAKEYVHASLTADAKRMISLMPEDIIDSLVEYGLIDSKQSFITYTQELADEAKYARDVKYGRGWQYSFEVTEIYRYSDHELDVYLYDYGFSRKHIKDVMDMSVTIAIEEDEVIDMTLTLLKIGRKWYVDYLE